MYLAACFAANGYGHFGKSFENDGVGVQPGRNRRARMRTTSEDSRHGAAFYGKVQRYSRTIQKNRRADSIVSNFNPQSPLGGFYNKI